VVCLDIYKPKKLKKKKRKEKKTKKKGCSQTLNPLNITKRTETVN